MTTEALTLELEPREALGKKVRKLRKVGTTPVHLYGSGVDSRSLQCATPKLIRTLAKAGANTPITLSVRGEDQGQLAFVREVQWHPMRGQLLHVDFLAVRADRAVSAQVPVVLTGESPGAIRASAVVVLQLRSLYLESLPLLIPHEIVVDLSVLTEVDGVIKAGDIVLPADVKLLNDAEEVVVRVEIPRVAVVEPTAAAEAADAAAAEGGAESEQA
ncbi:MAG: 50S ribosomal protein L25 [Dehalococcoidia bacterium]|nr:50S ribosomal protein L25 [Dehalococcoidia bacterium]MSQ17382.1 50S ribosomal protein L25 [Dehalococcoidia bacterium]